MAEDARSDRFQTDEDDSGSTPAVAAPVTGLPAEAASAKFDGPSLKRERAAQHRKFGLYAARLPGPSSPGSRQQPGSSASSFAGHQQQGQDGAGLDDPFYDSRSEQWTPSSREPASRVARKVPPPLSFGQISPRWDSLGATRRFFPTPPSSPLKTSIDGTVGPVELPAVPEVDVDNHGDNLSNPETWQQPNATSPTSLAFPGLSSHPYTPSSPNRRPGSAPRATGGAMVKNFSRPQRTNSLQTETSQEPAPSVPNADSLHSTVPEETLPGQHGSHTRSNTSSMYSDEQLTLFSQTNTTSSPASTAATTTVTTDVSTRGRGRSSSSVKSSSTLASHSLPYRQSNEQLNFAITRPSPISRHPRPPLANVLVSSYTPSLPHSYPQLSGTSSYDELKSSYRSQLTGSTMPATLSTTTGTERSSVVTKTSSIVSTGAGSGTDIGVGVEGGLSVEDVMGLYEKGFEDDEASSQMGEGHGNRGSRVKDSPPLVLHVDPVGDDGREANLGALGHATQATDDAATSGPPRNSGLSQRFQLAVSEPMLVLDPAESPSREHTSMQELGPQDDAEQPYTFDGYESSRMEPDPLPVAFGPVEGKHTTKVPAEGPQPAMAPAEDPSTRDRYGFHKTNNYISRQLYDVWNAEYSPYLERRRKKWVAYLKEQGMMTDRPNRFPARSQKTKRFVRKGIPPEWRGAAWFYYAGGPKTLAQNPGKYDDLVRRTGLDPNGSGTGELKEVDVEVIERDLHRTFPDNIRFKPAGAQHAAISGQHAEEEPAIISSLRRVLHAFALEYPKIGYCQSLNFLAGMLLLFVETEEQAFWLLVIITHDHLPNTHDVSLEGSKIDLGVLMAELKEHMSGVYNCITSDAIGGGGPFGSRSHKLPKPAASQKGSLRHLRPRNNRGNNNKTGAADPSRLPEITLCMTPWFMSCFIGQLPLETTLRVWDILFYEGVRTLFRVSLAILKMGEAEIRAVQDPMEMFAVVQTLPRRMLDANALVEFTYKDGKGFRKISGEDIARKRAACKADMRRWKDGAAAGPGDGDEVAEGEKGQDAENGRRPRDREGGARASQLAMDLDLAADMADVEAAGGSLRRKGTLFGLRKDKNHRRPGILHAEV